MTARDRGVTPVVGKVLELGLVALYVSAVSAVLFGGVVPGYRTAVGDELADRTLAAAAADVENAVPDAAAVDRTVEVTLPATIRGEHYRIAASNRTLRLEHPRGGIGAHTRLVLPGDAVVEGRWSSGGRTVVTVRKTENATRVRLRTREAT